ncbi:MAG TPA: hypothetical protein VKV34_07610, partial [Thermoleophilia bacterium]|nr:hypothetical protein [Thermoleophilia bacterium]
MDAPGGIEDTSRRPPTRRIALLLAGLLAVAAGYAAAHQAATSSPAARTGQVRVKPVFTLPTARSKWTGDAPLSLNRTASAALLPAGPWTIVTSPNYGPAPAVNDLDGVSCTTETSCVAVGEATTGALPVLHTLVESWDGSSWSIVPSPDEGVSSALVAVSCAAPDSCMAIGYGGAYGGALAETWNGSSWSTAPVPHVGALSAVSCSLPSACTAVGALPSGRGFAAENWNGWSWSAQIAAPAGPPTAIDTVSGISCVAPGYCVAVGTYSDGRGPSRTLIESSSGSGWSVVRSPNVGSSAASSALTSVSCSLASQCVAVGSYSEPGGPSRALVEEWNGYSWSVAAAGDDGPPGTGDTLTSVSCIAPAD